MSDLTSDQQAQIRAYLGYPSLNRYKDVRLEGILGASGLLDAATLTLVATYLSQLDAIDAQLTGGSIVGAAGIKKADEVEFYQGQAIRDVTRVGRMVVTRLSDILGVPLYGDYFGEAGYPGDSYSGSLGQSNRGNGMIPLG